MHVFDKVSVSHDHKYSDRVFEILRLNKSGFILKNN